MALMTKRKIAIFSAQYYPHMGGVEEFTKGIAKALANKGCDVTVVTNDTDAVGAGTRLENGVTVLRLPCHALLNGRLPLPRLSSSLRSLWRDLKDTSFDGVVVNTRFYPHSILGMKLARNNHARPVVIEHGSSYVSFGAPAIDAVERIYERTITRLGKRYSPRYFGVSAKSADWLKEFSIEAEGVIHNSLNAREYCALATKRRWRAELGIDEFAFLIVFAGRLIKEKGLDSLLEALELLNAKRGNYYLAIAGSGPLEEQTRRANSDHCRFVGRLDRGDLSALFREADCLCLPTCYPEGLPTVLLEAASQHAALIVSDCAGAREVVPDDSFGTILPEIAPCAIADAIDGYREDRERLERCKDAVAKRVEENFSWDSSADRLLAALF